MGTPHRQRMTDAPMKTAIVYTKSDCPLCTEALKVLDEQGWKSELVSIDGDEHLQSEYGTCVPVVVIDGKVRFRGRVSPVLLARLSSERP